MHRELILAGLVLILLTSLPPSPAVSGPSPVAPSPRAFPAPLHPDLTPRTGANTTSVAGTFFQNNTQIATFGPSNQGVFCVPGYTSTCYPNSANPSILSLANGSVGLAFEEVTTWSGTGCASSAGGGTMSRIGFALSSDHGKSFSSTRYLGDSGNSTCPFFQEIEPSFIVQGNGTIDGVYIAANESASTFQGAYPPLTLGYTARTDDALAFVQSYDNGTTFTNGTLLLPTTVGEQNLARPAIAAFGSTIYVAYENISNGSSTLPGTSSLPISVDLITSKDGGSTWQGPYSLPGENATENYSAFSPSLAVSGNGTLAVVYDTNRSCLAFCNGFAPAYGEDIVEVASRTNGSSFSPIRTISEVTEFAVFGSGGTWGQMSQLFQYAPSTASTWDAKSGRLYVTFTGGRNLSIVGGPYPFLVQLYDNYDDDVWVADSAIATGSWNVSMIAGRPANVSWTDYGSEDANYFNPGIAETNGTVYVTYSGVVEAAPASECGIAPPSAFGSSYFQYVVSLQANGSWSPPWFVDAEPQTLGLSFYNYPGYSSSITFTASGAPVVSYAIATEFQAGNAALISDAWNVSVATLFTGPTVNVTFTTSGLSPAASWAFSVSGNLFSTSLTALTVSNVPLGRSILIQSHIGATAVRYGVLEQVEDGTAWAAFSTNASWTFQVATFVSLQLEPQPANVPDAELLLSGTWNGLAYDYFHSWSTSVFFGSLYYYQTGCPFPWMVPAGLNVTFAQGAVAGSGTQGLYSTTTYVSYWTGTGNGSYTGPGPDVPLAFSTSPVNETFWTLGSGSYGVTFAAPGLPASSPFSFEFNGSRYNASGGASVVVGGIPQGAYDVTNASATSTISGWEYFGYPSGGNPVEIPQTLRVNLTFALVNLSAPYVPITIRAEGLTPGTDWQIGLNGTVYSSTSPSINLSVRPGVYPIQPYAVTSANGSAHYLPNSSSAGLNVTGAGTYNLRYVPAYELSVLVGPGGTVGGASGSQWGARGQSYTLDARPDPGFGWGGWTGSGPGAYTGRNRSIQVTLDGPIVESATFYPLPSNRFNLSVSEIGVPNGTLWTVYVDGRGYSSSTQTLLIPGMVACSAGASYSLLVPYAYANGTTDLARYVPESYVPTICGGQNLSLVFDPSYYVSVSSTAGGTASPLSGWVSSQGTVALSAQADTGYFFVGWSGTGLGSYTGAMANVALTDLTGPINETAAFAPDSARALYEVSFNLSRPLPMGITWWVTIGGVTHSSSTGKLIVSGLPVGTYAVGVGAGKSPDGLARAVPDAPELTLNLTSNTSRSIAFFVDFWVSVYSIGPGSVAPGPSWQRNGTSVSLVATPTAPALFLGWSGSGLGAYNGTSLSDQLTVLGPLTEVASFALPVSGASGPPTASAIAPIDILLILAAAGIAVGAAAGAIVTRRRRGGGRSPRSSEEVPPASEEDGGVSTEVTPEKPEGESP